MPPPAEKEGGLAPLSKGTGAQAGPWPPTAAGTAPAAPEPGVAPATPRRRRRRRGLCPLHSSARGARGPPAAPRPPVSRRRRSAHAGAPEEMDRRRGGGRIQEEKRKEKKRKEKKRKEKKREKMGRGDPTPAPWWPEASAVVVAGVGSSAAK